MAAAKKPATGLRRVLAILAAALCGCAIGVGVFGVGYSELPSYMGTDPQTCTNCHVMQDNYDAWRNGPHARVATCKDCHLPHDNAIAQLAVELEDGVIHGYKFTFNKYPTNIVIRESSLETVNGACLSCHDVLTTQIRYIMGAEDDFTCTHCHEHIGHD